MHPSCIKSGQQKLKTSPLLIRPMTQVDLPGALAVISSGFGRGDAQMAQPDLNEMFCSTAWRPFFYVAVNHDDGQIVGVTGYSVSWLNYGVYELFWVGVLEECRGMGAG